MDQIGSVVKKHGKKQLASYISASLPQIVTTVEDGVVEVIMRDRLGVLTSIKMTLHDWVQFTKSSLERAREQGEQAPE